MFLVNIKIKKILFSIFIFNLIILILSFQVLAFAENKVIIGSDDNKNSEEIQKTEGNNLDNTKPNFNSETTSPNKVIIGSDIETVNETKDTNITTDENVVNKATDIEIKTTTENNITTNNDEINKNSLDEKTKEIEITVKENKEVLNETQENNVIESNNENKTNSQITLPNPPTNVEAKIIGNKVKLTWDLVKDAHHYNIYRDVEENITKKAIKYNTNQNEFEDEEAMENKDIEYYYYFITTCIKSNDSKTKYIESTPTKIKVEVLDKTPPNAVNNLKITLSENEKVRFEWEAPDKNKEYKYVIFKNETENENDFKEISTTDKLFYEESGLKNNNTYFYYVVPISKNNIKGKASEKLKIVIKDTIAPNPPTNLKAVANFGYIELQWDKSTSDDISHYIVYKSVNNKNDYKKIDTKELITDTKFVDREIKGGTEYWYKVSCVDKSNNESSFCELKESVKAKENIIVNIGKYNNIFYALAFKLSSNTLYIAESEDGKIWQGWSVITNYFMLCEDFNENFKISFLREGKKIVAFCYDTKNMIIKTTMSSDFGKTWKNWSVYSTNFPLPESFNENWNLSFGSSNQRIYVMCYDKNNKSIWMASTADGQSWKWWKEVASNLRKLPNQNENSFVILNYNKNQIDVFSYDPISKSIYNGVILNNKNDFDNVVELTVNFIDLP